MPVTSTACTVHGTATAYGGAMTSSDPPWEPVDWDAEPDWAFSAAGPEEPDTLYLLSDDAVASSRRTLEAALAQGGLDQRVSAADEGRHASLRRLVCDLIEEYGRHTGHADLLREAVDGLVGEDPPADWAPRCGAGASVPPQASASDGADRGV